MLGPFYLFGRRWAAYGMTRPRHAHTWQPTVPGRPATLRENKLVQANDWIVRGASDHGPRTAAVIEGVLAWENSIFTRHFT